MMCYCYQAMIVQLWIWVFFNAVDKYSMFWEFECVLSMTDVNADAIHDVTFICLFVYISKVQWATYTEQYTLENKDAKISQ